MFLISIGRLNIKTSSTIVLLGGLSYPLYLTHHMFGRYLIDMLAPVVNAYLLLLGLTILAIALAFVIYVAVDKRMAKSLRAFLTKLLIRSETEANATANN
jgi:peptidoglycan/LPS O-acetylase OafA/YrhL